jgi:hypothetical protein
MYLHICTTYKRANGRQANQYTHLGHASVDTSNMITFKHKHTHRHTHTCIYIYYHTIYILSYYIHIIIVYMDKCCKHSHKTSVINDAFPPLSFFSRDNSANRRSTSCPMSLKAPAACEFAGDWWRVDRQRREFLTRVSPLEIFNGHLYIYVYIYIYGTYIRPLRFWAMGLEIYSPNMALCGTVP